MKKLFTLALLGLSTLIFAQQTTFHLSFQVKDNTGTALPNYTVLAQDLSDSTVGYPTLATMTTDQNGYIVDTVVISRASGILGLIGDHCRPGRGRIVVTVPFQSASGPINYQSPFVLPCDYYCGNFVTSVDRVSMTDLEFTATGGSGAANYQWTFSDGTVLSGLPTRSFNASPGGMSCDAEDLTHGCLKHFFLLEEPFAWLEIDSTNSGNGSINLVNATWASKDVSNYTQMYYWNFGDNTPEDSISGAFPTHVYSQPGTYTITLVYREMNGGYIMHYDFTSITFSVDANGNLYKNGFTINVIDQNSIGLAENEATSFVIYPQPSTGDIHIQTEAQIEGIEVFNTAGVLVKVKSEGDLTTLDLSDQPAGVYMLNIKTDKNTVVEKCIVR